MQCDAVCCSVLQCGINEPIHQIVFVYQTLGKRERKREDMVKPIYQTFSFTRPEGTTFRHSVMQCVAVCCSALQCVVVRCSVLSMSQLIQSSFFNRHQGRNTSGTRSSWQEQYMREGARGGDAFNHTHTRARSHTQNAHSHTPLLE